MKKPDLKRTDDYPKLPEKACCRATYLKGFHQQATQTRYFRDGQREAAKKFIELYRDTPLHGADCQPCQLFLNHCEEKVMEALMPKQLD